jgi:hypothetical protein
MLEHLPALIDLHIRVLRQARANCAKVVQPLVDSKALEDLMVCACAFGCVRERVLAC